MQRGTVGRHGDGWRGRWREDGRLRATRTVRTKGEASRLLDAELRRIELGERWMPPITLEELAERFLAQYAAGPETVKFARRRLVRPVAALGAAQAGDVTPEAIQRVLAAVPGKAWRYDICRTLRMTYRFGVANRLVASNPAALVKIPMPRRSERMLPLESWAEVEAVAEEAGAWGPLIIFMADTGARPGEAIRLEHRHVHGSRVELPGTKTAGAWRTVHMTTRGVEDVRMPPRAMWIRRVFNVHGRPISWPYFTREVWHPALKLYQPFVRADRDADRVGRAAAGAIMQRFAGVVAAPRTVEAEIKLMTDAFQRIGAVVGSVAAIAALLRSSAPTV